MLTKLVLSTILLTCTLFNSVSVSAEKVPNTCCLNQPIYKGMIGKVTAISEPIFINGALFDGWVYKYTYILPNGFSEIRHTTLSKVKLDINTGDYFVWVPSDKEMRDRNPERNFHVARIINRKTCKSYEADYDIQASSIPGM